jgi:hypothetical protein
VPISVHGRLWGSVMLSNIRDTVPAAHVIAAHQLACEVQRRGGVTPAVAGI